MPAADHEIRQELPLNLSISDSQDLAHLLERMQCVKLLFSTEHVDLLALLLK